MLLKDADREKYFHAANGTVIRSIWELEPSLAGMGDDTFRYHSNNDKNDFSAWIRDVIGDAELASEILACRDKAEMRISVLRKLVKVLRDEAGL